MRAAYKRLTGAVAKRALVKALIAVSQLIADAGKRIQSIDVNPFFVETQRRFRAGRAGGAYDRFLRSSCVRFPRG